MSSMPFGNFFLPSKISYPVQAFKLLSFFFTFKIVYYEPSIKEQF